MKFRVSAKSVGYLEGIVEAKNEDEAYVRLQEMLDNGDLSELDGWIDDKNVEPL